MPPSSLLYMIRRHPAIAVELLIFQPIRKRLWIVCIFFLWHRETSLYQSLYYLNLFSKCWNELYFFLFFYVYYLEGREKGQLYCFGCLMFNKKNNLCYLIRKNLILVKSNWHVKRRVLKWAEGMKKTTLKEI